MNLKKCKKPQVGFELTTSSLLRAHYIKVIKILILAAFDKNLGS
jgi:hypothetical protein